MATSAVRLSAGPAQDYNDLLALLRSKNLDSVYSEFMKLTNAPPDLKCLLIVAANLHDTFKRLRAWRQIGPFKGWPMLMLYLCLHAKRIQQQFGHIVVPPRPQAGNPSAKFWLRRVFRNEFEDRPLYLMLCCTHPGLEVRYGALQLQILYARWEEVQAAVAAKATPIPIPSRPGKPANATRIGRHPRDYALAVRDLSNSEFTHLLRYLRPEQLPADFLKSPGDKAVSFPLGQNYGDRFDRIINYCDRRHVARQGHSNQGGTRGRSVRETSY